MTVPSIEAVSGLVEELRRLPVIPGSWVATAVTRAADALEAQARELAERDKWVTYWQTKCQATRTLQLEAQARISALENAVRVKDEGRLKAALDYLAENTSRSLAFDGKWDCEDDNSDLWIVTEVQGGINDREWVLIGSGTTPAEALLNALPDQPSTALSNGEPHDR